MHAPYVIYADFETLNVKVNKKNKNTVQITDQPPSSYCYVIVRYDGKVWKEPVLYRGDDAAYNFIKQVQADGKEIIKSLKK